MFSRASSSDEWNRSYSSKLEDWKTETATGYQLVGCVTVKDSKKVKECNWI